MRAIFSQKELSLLTVPGFPRSAGENNPEKSCLNKFIPVFSAIFDSLLLCYYLMDNGFVGSFMRMQNLGEPYWYRVSYPKFLCPLKGFVLSCTIFMVVAISAERHRAICSPLTHKPTYWPYVLIVFCTAGKNLLME